MSNLMSTSLSHLTVKVFLFRGLLFLSLPSGATIVVSRPSSTKTRSNITFESRILLPGARHRRRKSRNLKGTWDQVSSSTASYYSSKRYLWIEFLLLRYINLIRMVLAIKWDGWTLQPGNNWLKNWIRPPRFETCKNVKKSWTSGMEVFLNPLHYNNFLKVQGCIGSDDLGFGVC